MLHEWIRHWFEIVEQYGYSGVFFLMALESTIVPIPSEIIIPPAAYWAEQGRLNFWGVVFAGAFGSTFGSLLCYAFSAAVGRPLLMKYSKWLLLTPEKIELAEKWILDFSTSGVFFARLLPVVRHLIGFPAGLIRMPLASFITATFSGSFLWCAILGWFGASTLGKNPNLLDSPDQMISTIKHDLVWFVAMVVGLAALWMVVQIYSKKLRYSRV